LASRGAGLLAGALALAGGSALLLGALDGEPVPPASTAAIPSTTPGVVLAGPAGRADRATSDRVRGPMLDHSEPAELRIRSIGVRSRLVRLGLDPAGALEVPTVAAEAGWYTGAPAPGTLGPAVIAGHVSWNSVPGVFYRLGELRRGDRVEVLRRDGRTAVFAVTGVGRFAKDGFPTEAVYGTTDHAALRLITCGGRYDTGAARFEDNVVVFARLVGAT
jgi:hypothetical protein